MILFSRRVVRIRSTPSNLCPALSQLPAPAGETVQPSLETSLISSEISEIEPGATVRKKGETEGREVAETFKRGEVEMLVSPTICANFDIAESTSNTGLVPLLEKLSLFGPSL